MIGPEVAKRLVRGAETPATNEGVEFKRHLLGVWLVVGSAVVLTVAAVGYEFVLNGGQPPSGDMIGHAATAEWLRTLPWWDWRGWSDWFYGGQAIGVNYPPLPHAVARFVHPSYGQLAAVALGLLVLLPWATLRLARAVGYAPRTQLLSVAATLLLASLAAFRGWLLPGFNPTLGFYGSWPAMFATVCGLFCAGWAASCRKPIVGGIVAGLGVLWNPTVMGGVAIVCAALLATSGVSVRQALRWSGTAIASAIAVCAWWLVPFLAGWERLVRWELPLSRLWGGFAAGVAIVSAIWIAAAWTIRLRLPSSRRLAIAACSGLLVALFGELFGVVRAERWMVLPLVIAALAVAELVATQPRTSHRRPRPAWTLLGAAMLAVFMSATRRFEILLLGIWLLWMSRSRLAAAGAVAWMAVLLILPFKQTSGASAETLPSAGFSFTQAVSGVGPDATGLIYLTERSDDPARAPSRCNWSRAWEPATNTRGRIRPLRGLYRETSATAEFIRAPRYLPVAFSEPHPQRPSWAGAWERAGRPHLDGEAAAVALGARWTATCDAEGNVSLSDLPAVTAGGVTLAAYPSEAGWHEAAVNWWLATASGPAAGSADFDEPVPVLSAARGGGVLYPPNRPARGVTLRSAGETLTVHADTAGWAWLRVPWDPYWRSLDGTPVLKGGPGHLVVWANEGVTQLRWSVPRSVDVAAASITGAAALAVLGLSVVNRRRGFTVDPGRSRPVADAVEVFADTVDGWIRGGAQRLRRLRGRRGAEGGT